MITNVICCFLLLTVFGEVSAVKRLAASKGGTVALFSNVTFDSTKGCLTLYLNGDKREPKLLAKWGLEHCRENKNIVKYFMDENNDVWIHNISETDEGTYSLKAILDDNTEDSPLECKVKLIVKGQSLTATKGETVVLFLNVAFDKENSCLALYFCDDKSKTELRAKWGLQRCRENMNINIFMDTNNNIWIHNISETDEGTYVLKTLLDNGTEDTNIEFEITLIIHGKATGMTNESTAAPTKTETTVGNPPAFSPNTTTTSTTADSVKGIIALLVLMLMIMVFKPIVKRFCPKRKKCKKATNGQLQNEDAPNVQAEQLQLLNRNSPTGGTDMCQICSKNATAMVFVPCGHRVACRDCANVAEMCPACNTEKTAQVEPFCGEV